MSFLSMSFCCDFGQIKQVYFVSILFSKRLKSHNICAIVEFYLLAYLFIFLCFSKTIRCSGVIQSCHCLTEYLMVFQDLQFIRPHKSLQTRVVYFKLNISLLIFQWCYFKHGNIQVHVVWFSFFYFHIKCLCKLISMFHFSVCLLLKKVCLMIVKMSIIILLTPYCVCPRTNKKKHSLTTRC